MTLPTITPVFVDELDEPVESDTITVIVGKSVIVTLVGFDVGLEEGWTVDGFEVGLDEGLADGGNDNGNVEGIDEGLEEGIDDDGQDEGNDDGLSSKVGLGDEGQVEGKYDDDDGKLDVINGVEAGCSVGIDDNGCPVGTLTGWVTGALVIALVKVITGSAVVST